MEQVKRNPDYHLDDLSSEFDAQSEAERGAGRKRKRGDFWDKEYPGEVSFYSFHLLQIKYWIFFHDKSIFRYQNRLVAKQKIFFKMSMVDYTGFLVFIIFYKYFRKINRLMQLDAYARHKEMMNLYTLCYPGAAEKYLKRDTSNDRTDYDVLKVCLWYYFNVIILE